jgi:hypothetical protein
MPPPIRFNNLGGAIVQVDRWLLLNRWACRGCGHYGPATLNARTASTSGNQHAAVCRALPR